MRALVVEDDPALAVFLQKGLMLEGHEVQRASDGDAALEMAAQEEPDLVVLDLGLPRRDGTEVLEILRRDFPARWCWCLPVAATSRSVSAAWTWAPTTSCSSLSAFMS